ncbi:MAG TPA: hypothetical protein VNX46_03145 [Candidatus Acidoferrum sp.]|nr:hypothetical protein [Candidatus Acidoferrum sp.]
MKTLVFLLAILMGCTAIKLAAQGTAFTYQGRLNDGGTVANGSYDFQFSLFNASTNGNLISGPVTDLAVAVNGGLFSTSIDFGRVFSGTNYWLAIDVRTNGSTNVFTDLQPLQPLLPVPYAIFANTASNLDGSLSATQLSGTLPSAQLSGTYSGPVSFVNSGNSFSGNGAALTALNGSQVTSGTVADARLSGNVALLNGNQTFSGINLITNRNNTFIGNFFGNGLVGWIPVSGTSTQAMANAGYLLLNSSLTTVTLPPTASLITGDIVRVSGGGAGGWVVAQNASQAIVGSISGYSQTSWLPSSVGTAPWINMASSASGGLMAAVANNSGQVHISRDFGYSWANSGSPSAVWRCVACSADGSHLIAGQLSAGALFYSTNYGSSWAGGVVANNNWASIAMSASGQNAVAVANSGGVYTSSNGGATWQLQTGAPTSAGWIGVASSADGSKLAAVSSPGFIYVSSNSGLSWTPENVGGGSLGWSGVASSADGTKLAASVYGGRIYTSVNSGANWQQSGAPAANYQNVVSSSDGSKLAADVFGGAIYTSINFGSLWAPQSAPLLNWAPICASADGSHLAAAAYNGNIYYSSSSTLTSTTVGVNGYLAGPQFSAVELQYLGNGQFMPISFSGTLWGN